MLTFLIVLPLVLRKLSPEELAVWYLFGSVMALQTIADIGFAPSFSRAIAYAVSGAKSIEQSSESQSAGEPNWTLTEKIVGTMRPVYGRLAAAAALLLAVFGTIALQRPVSRLSDPLVGWAAWALVVAAMWVSTKANLYGAYLQGVNQVARFRRWEAITLVGASLSSVVALLCGGRLLALVAVSQVWVLVAALRDRQLARTVVQGRFRSFAANSIDPTIFRQLWLRAWRSGVGIILSRGVVWSSGLIVAQYVGAAEIAAYLLALRLVQALADLASAPLYSKLPLLAGWYSAGRRADIVSVARRGMRLGFAFFVAGAVTLGIAGDWLLDVLGSSIAFPAPDLWLAMSLAFFVERYGAFHIQLYSTTNHIIWHTANGVTGTLFLAGALFLLPRQGVLAYPVAMLLSYVSFFSWYAARHTYRAFGLSFVEFERSTSLAPFAALLLYMLFVFLRGA